MQRLVHRFGVSATDGRSDMKDLLGGKGANLAEMATAGLPVPPGFTIGTTVCKEVAEAAARGERDALPKQLWPEIDAALREVETAMGLRFGDPEAPLLVSVRSGAAVSMPGMMDTVLNLGMNEKVAAGLAKRTKNPRFAWDAYRRFIEMFGNVVMGAKREAFGDAMDALKNERGAMTDQDLGEGDLRELVKRFLGVYREQVGEEFPTDPRQQLERAILAVFRSW
ncbi:MAG: pyruvate, phosphate dikinase, partial [Myxococcota bacterium]|nr:pyruvate, phosphate dikinase [Myxococcota bacterium]